MAGPSFPKIRLDRIGLSTVGPRTTTPGPALWAIRLPAAAEPPMVLPCAPPPNRTPNPFGRDPPPREVVPMVLPAARFARVGRAAGAGEKVQFRMSWVATSPPVAAVNPMNAVGPPTVAG